MKATGSHEGQSMQVLGDRVTIKLPSDQSPHGLSIVTVRLPPLTPHGYRNPAEQPARFLAWTVGGPMDRFFVKMVESVHELPRDLGRMQAVMAEHGVARVA